MATETRDTAHDELNEELNAYLDGQLDAARRAELEGHLEVCGVCQADLDDLRVTRALLRAQPLLRAPRPFALPAEPEARGAAWWAGLLAWGWRLGSVATAACLAVTVLSARPAGVSQTVGTASDSASLSKAAPNSALSGAPSGAP
ncbi:MAG TPA: zf-HC2 domain-containing protein, partial [Chloroflexota bacterium]|nr:zf-HC2 domain-containing protein [Chloroflexota bacterium]